MADQLSSGAEPHGTRNQKTQPGTLRNCSILIPPLPEQRAIAHILGTLDDKIELNRRMNETLEAMARAIFKSWFVDFDPVRAKMDGRQPVGMDAETGSCFRILLYVRKADSSQQGGTRRDSAALFA